MAEQIYFDFAKTLLDKSKNCEEEFQCLFYDESTVMLFKALTTTDKPQMQNSIKQTILRNFDYNSKSMQDKILRFMQGGPSVSGGSSIPMSSAPDNSASIDASVKNCQVTKFEKVKWEDVIISPIVKKNIMDDIVVPLKHYKAKLRGIMPGHILGMIMVICSIVGYTVE